MTFSLEKSACSASLGFPRLPTGWLACDGSLHAISQYEVLFSLIGTTYGGDGISTFATPSLAGRLPIDYGSRDGKYYSIGEISGEEQVTLSANQLPAHSHAFTATQAPAVSPAVKPDELLARLSQDTMYTGDVSGVASVTMSSASTSRTGGSRAHDNLMPTLTTNFCIAYTGIYPSRN